jgi:hypothetical protein
LCFDGFTLINIKLGLADASGAVLSVPAKQEIYSCIHHIHKERSSLAYFIPYGVLLVFPSESSYVFFLCLHRASTVSKHYLFTNNDTMMHTIKITQY